MHKEGQKMLTYPNLVCVWYAGLPLGGHTHTHTHTHAHTHTHTHTHKRVQAYHWMEEEVEEAGGG